MMQVSMDGLRKRLVSDYNSLVLKLNNSVKDPSWDPQIIIDPEMIRKEIEGLKNAIVVLAFSSLENSWESMDEETRFEDFFDADDVENN
jgi:hypothetical protein